MSEISIFNEILEHQLQGVMFHGDMANMFDFMDLHGLKREQEYHFYDEMRNMRCTDRYIINNLSAMPDIDNVRAAKEIIPAGWRNAKRAEVTPSLRAQYTQVLFGKWKEWEYETRDFLNKKYKELCDLSAYSHAAYVLELICDVEEEIKYLERQHLEYTAVGWDMKYIFEFQQDMHDKYKEMIESIF